MNLSLNEVEGLVWKAARGAGLAWGLAEDIAQAARWLAAAGFDWAPALVACLADAEARGGMLPIPIETAAGWSPADEAEWLSPLLCGPLLSDLARGSALRQPLAFRRLACPILLLPFVAGAARDLGRTLHLAWPCADIRCSPAGKPSSAVAITDRAEWVTVSLLADRAGEAAVAPPFVARAAIRDAEMRRFAAWVQQTYVPASLESRLAGAGAGLTDND